MLFFRTTKILKSKKKRKHKIYFFYFLNSKSKKTSLFSLASEREQVLLISFFVPVPARLRCLSNAPKKSSCLRVFV